MDFNMFIRFETTENNWKNRDQFLKDYDQEFGDQLHKLKETLGLSGGHKIRFITINDVWIGSGAFEENKKNIIVQFMMNQSFHDSQNKYANNKAGLSDYGKLIERELKQFSSKFGLKCIDCVCLSKFQDNLIGY